MNNIDKLEELERKLEKEPKNGKLWAEKGDLLGVLERFADAIDAYSMAVVYCPFDSRVRLGKGRKYISAKRYPESFAELTLAIRLDPDYYDNWYYLGVSYCLSGYLTNALDTFKHCLKLALKHNTNEIPSTVDWLWTINMKLGRRGDAQDVLKYVDENTKYKPNELSYKKRVLMYKGLLAPEDVIDVEYLKNSDRPELYYITEAYAIANYYYINGDTKKSAEYLKKIKAVDKYHHAFAYTLAVQDMVDRGIES